MPLSPPPPPPSPPPTPGATRDTRPGVPLSQDVTLAAPMGAPTSIGAVGAPTNTFEPNAEWDRETHTLKITVKPSTLRLSRRQSFGPSVQVPVERTLKCMLSGSLSVCLA